MVRLRNEGNSSTLFQFEGKTKILRDGSLTAKFKSNVTRNPRLDAKDILHKKGATNTEFNFVVILSGDAKFTNEDTLMDLIRAQTTIYLDTEGINDNYNGKYDFIGNAESSPIAKQKRIIIKFRLIENVN